MTAILPHRRPFFRAAQARRRNFLPTLEVLEGRLNPATFEVGPGLAFPTINAVPWENLAAGDTVRIHWRPEPYREKILISTSGTAAAPIRVVGVAGPNGERPAIDGQDASTRPQAAFPFAGTQDRGLVTLTRDSQHPFGFKPSYIQIEGLELRNANRLNTFTDAAGATRTYIDNAAALFVERGEHIVVRNCTLTGSGNGLFVASGEEEASFSRDILVDGNDIFGNGNVGSDRHHNVYTEASGMVFQYNHFGELRPGSFGIGLKDRSAGTVIRYNWIEGGARLLDLVDPEDSAPLMLQEPNFRDTYVYGNVLVDGPEDAGNLVHYGGDSGVTDIYRKGTLHFYHNTVVVRADQSARFNTTLLQVETNDEAVELYNNILYTESATPGATPTQFNLARDFGTISVGTNWVSPGWMASIAFGGTITGTDNILPPPNSPNDAGFVNLAGNDYHLRADSMALNQGQPLDGAAAAAGHVVNRQYVVPQSSEARPVTGAALDLGAFELVAALGPVLRVDARNTTGVADGSAARPFASVQAAVDAAPADATIQVAAGTYTENVMVPDRSLTLLGGFAGGTAAAYAAGQAGDFTTRDPATLVTTLRAARATEPVLLLNNLTDRTHRIDGFTVTGGLHGIYVVGDFQQFTNVTIAHNVIENNGPARLQTEGEPFAFVGGGIYASNATITIADNVIRNNQANRGGGLFVASQSDYTITGNLIDGNSGWDDHGGGVVLNPLPVAAAGNGTFSRNTIRNNVASRAFNYGWAGGILIPGNLDPASLKPARLDHNVYTGNFAPSLGGALFVDDGATVLLEHELIYQNHTQEVGGAAIYVDGDAGGVGSSLTVRNSTVADNTPVAGPGVGNGITVESNSTATVQDSLFWGNGPDFFLIPDTNARINVSFTLSQQDQSGTGNRSADPLFANPAAGDYHLKSTGGRWDPTAGGGAGAFVLDAVMSPAIDAGDPASDFSLEPAPNGGRVNLGAYGNTAEASRSAPAAATQLRFGPLPASGRAGQPLPAVRVTVTDALGTVVPSAASVTIAAAGPGGFSSGTLTVTAANGVAEFTDLVLPTAGTYTLTATAPGLAAAVSGPFTVNPPDLTIPPGPGPGGIQTTQPRTGEVLPLVTAVRQLKTKQQRANRRRATVVVTNTGPSRLDAVRLVVNGLNNKIKLNGASTTVLGSPSVVVGGLSPGESVTVMLSFSNRKNLPLRFSTEMVAG